MDKNIIIKDKDFRFNYRVAALFINQDKILLQSTKTDPYLFLPGGRVQYNETTSTAIKREMQEELGISIKDEEMILTNVVENFFNHDNKMYHELLFIYRISNKDINSIKEIKVLDKEDTINKWYPISSLEKIDIRPDIIKDSIKTNTIIHNIVNK